MNSIKYPTIQQPGLTNLDAHNLYEAAAAAMCMTGDITHLSETIEGIKNSCWVYVEKSKPGSKPDHAKTFEPYSLILLMAVFNHHEYCDKLISKGCDISYSNAYVGNCVTVAFSKREMKDDNTKIYEMADYFLDQGLDPNIKNIHGITPLMYAVSWSRGMEYVTKLLNKKADVNMTDNMGNNALMFAISANNEQVANYLIDNDCNFMISNIDNCTPFMLAMRVGMFGIAQRILNMCSDVVNQVDIEHNNALYYACRHKHEDFANVLIDSGINVAYTKKDGITAIHWALENKMKQVATRIIHMEQMHGCLNDARIMKLIEINEYHDLHEYVSAIRAESSEIAA